MANVSGHLLMYSSPARVRMCTRTVESKLFPCATPSLLSRGDPSPNSPFNYICAKTTSVNTTTNTWAPSYFFRNCEQFVIPENFHYFLERTNRATNAIDVFRSWPFYVIKSARWLPRLGSSSMLDAGASAGAGADVDTDAVSTQHSILRFAPIGTTKMSNVRGRQTSRFIRPGDFAFYKSNAEIRQ